MKKGSLKRRAHQFSDSTEQLKHFSRQVKEGKEKAFSKSLGESDLFPLLSTELGVFQMNLGKMCNQVCKHCHVDAGPDRKEIMSKETMMDCFTLIREGHFHTVDLTGGAPEMNPNFKWLVEQLSQLEVKIIVRCNLTIILAGERYAYLPQFFAKHKVEVVSSLPHFSSLRTDAQRGKGVFNHSIEALRLLNEQGYGKKGSDLILNLVYNPSGAFLPSGQESLEEEFKRRLFQKYKIEFNSLFAITNLPISRFLEYLMDSGNYEEYMSKLISAYNPEAAKNVMCRSTLSIGWDGYIYDCDFNQMLNLKIKSDKAHVSEIDLSAIKKREIVIHQHCFGCTAGAGSSCGGEVT